MNKTVAYDKSLIFLESEKCRYRSGSLPECLLAKVDEDEMATRRDLTVPSSLNAPLIDITSGSALRYIGGVASYNAFARGGGRSNFPGS